MRDDFNLLEADHNDQSECQTELVRESLTNGRLRWTHGEDLITAGDTVHGWGVAQDWLREVCQPYEELVRELIRTEDASA